MGAKLSGNKIDKRLDHKFVILISYEKAKVYYKIAGYSYLDI